MFFGKHFSNRKTSFAAQVEQVEQKMGNAFDWPQKVSSEVNRSKVYDTAMCALKLKRILATTHSLDHSPPEMQRCDITWAILQLKALGIDDVLHFDFLSPPPSDAIVYAVRARDFMYVCMY